MNKTGITSHSGIILKTRWALLGLIIVLFYFTPSTTKATTCTDDNLKIYAASIINPVYRSTAAGAKIGTLNFSGDFTCSPEYNLSPKLYFIPDTFTPSPVSKVCTTNIPGVGIRYLFPYGTQISDPTCTGSAFITNLSPINEPQHVDRAFAELVFTGEEPPLPGIYNINLPGVFRRTGNGSYYNTRLNTIIPITLAGTFPKILFPGYATSNPVVNLDIRFNRGNYSHMTSPSEKNLDICFYDGLDSISTIMNIYFTDNWGSGRDFNVKLNGQDSGDISNIITYNVSIKNPTTGVFIPVSNGQAFNWSNTDELKNPKKQMVSGANGLSSCVLSSIKFSTPSFNFTNKVTGLYSGQLSVIFTPST